MAEPGAEQQLNVGQIHENEPHEQADAPVGETPAELEVQSDKAADEPAVEPSTAADAAADGRSSNHSNPAEDTPQPAAEAPTQAAPESAVTPADEGPEQQPVKAAAEAEEEEKEVVQAPLASTPAVPQQQPTAEAPAEEQEQQQEAHEDTEEQEVQQQQAQDVQEEVVQEQHQHIPAQHAAQHPHKHVSHAAAAPHSPGSTHGGYGTFPDRAANGKALTFTGPPYVPVAKPYRRVDYSHSSVQLMKISHDNQLLVNHLTTISKAVPAWTKNVNAPPAPGNTASSAVNRRKAATTIAQENHALYQRLVAIRPSKDISRDTLEAEHRRNETYRANCAQFKSPSPTHKAAASH